MSLHVLMKNTPVDINEDSFEVCIDDDDSEIKQHLPYIKGGIIHSEENVVNDKPIIQMVPAVVPHKPVTCKKRVFKYKTGEYINNKQYRIKCIIGEGAFSIVYMVIECTTGAEYGLKVLDYKYDSSVKSVKDVMTKPNNEEEKMYKIELEINNLIKKADSLDIIPLTKIKKIMFDSKNHKLLILIPLYPYTLYDCPTTIRTNRAFAKIIFNIAFGLYFLHDCLNYVHTDLKADNIIFIDRNMNVRINDFGLAVKCTPGKTCTGRISPLFYRAPEVYLKNNWSFPADIWSFGCIILELIDTRFYKELRGCDPISFMYEWGKFMGFIEVNSINHDYIENIEVKAKAQKSKDSNFSDFLKMNKTDYISIARQIKQLTTLPVKKHWLQHKYKDVYDPDLLELVEGCLIMNPEERWTPKRIIESTYIKKHFERGVEKFENMLKIPKYSTYELSSNALNVMID